MKICQADPVTADSCKQESITHTREVVKLSTKYWLSVILLCTVDLLNYVATTQEIYNKLKSVADLQQQDKLANPWVTSLFDLGLSLSLNFGLSTYLRQKMK